MRSVEFLDVMSRMIPESKLQALCAQHAPLPRTEPKLSAEQVVTGLIYHQLQPGGTLANSSAQLHGIRMSDSAHTQRRQGLPVQLFDEVMAAALRPLASADQAECFFEGYRLVGADGTQWSVTNTPQILSQLPKAACRRFKAAFAKLRLVTLVELGTHAPLAAASAPVSEGEQTVAKRLWKQVPDRSLLIADRLFGTARTLYQATQEWQGRDIVCLVRVKDNIKVEVIERLVDGSAIVEVPVRENQRQIATLRVREIRAEGRTLSGERFNLRLWTTLLDEKRYPADTLARHYVERWEQELYYRELKLDVRSAPVLASHTVETALQEIAALVLATAVMAQLRVAAAEKLDVPTRRVSFLKVLLATQQLWQTFRLGADLLNTIQRHQVCKRYFEDLRHTAVLPPRRSRSCPRALRQPVKPWPRMTDQPSYTGNVQITLVPI